MGFFDKIKKVVSSVGGAVKDTYQKADEKLGGYLPGGQTPDEVSAKSPGVTQEQVDAQREINRQENLRLEEQERLKATSEPGGWKNVVDVAKIAVNPFSEERIKANLEPGIVKTGLELVANNPGTTAAIAVGLPVAIKAATGAIVAVTSKTAVQEAAKVGTIQSIKLSADVARGAGVESVMATNTATTKITATWLTKLVGAASSPKFVVGGVMASIGTYPFAGFIKEEAIQTIGFGVRSALDNNDVEGAERALKLQEEILDPALWEQIKAKIPFVNIIADLDDFYKAAVIKMAIDKRVVADLKIKLERGETDAQMYARIEEERIAKKEAERIADEEYYALVANLTKANKLAERKADEEYWANITAKREEADAKKKKDDEDYWNAVYKSMAERKKNSESVKVNYE